jgi:hypothetical protein
MELKSSQPSFDYPRQIIMLISVIWFFGVTFRISHLRASRGIQSFGADRIRQDVDLVTVRVNYRWGGPAVARY